MGATSTRSTLAADIAALASASAAFASETRANVATITENHAALVNVTGRLAVSVESLSDAQLSIARRVLALEAGSDRKQRTSTVASGVRETAPKQRRTRRTVSDPTGNAAATRVADSTGADSAALARLTASWAKPTATDRQTLKLAAVNALRHDGATDSAIYRMVLSGTLPIGTDAVRESAADAAVADAVAAPIVRGKTTGRTRRILLDGYTVTITRR